MKCPRCGDDCMRTTFDVMPPAFGPWECPSCGWKEAPAGAGEAAEEVEKAMRNTGRTSEQMKAAANGAVFIWCNGNTAYPSRLAKHLGRGDLTIVSPASLEHISWWLGRRLTGVTLDHAAELTSLQFSRYDQIIHLIEKRASVEA